VPVSDQTGKKVIELGHELALGDDNPRSRLMYVDEDGNAYDVENMVDALDHIMRVTRQAHRMTNRLKFIELRAKSVLEGTEEWRDYDYPKNRQKEQENWRRRYKGLEEAILKLSRVWRNHPLLPDGSLYDGPCDCDTCRSYG